MARLNRRTRDKQSYDSSMGCCAAKQCTPEVNEATAKERIASQQRQLTAVRANPDLTFKEKSQVRKILSNRDVYRGSSLSPAQDDLRHYRSQTFDIKDDDEYFKADHVEVLERIPVIELTNHCHTDSSSQALGVGGYGLSHSHSRLPFQRLVDEEVPPQHVAHHDDVVVRDGSDPTSMHSAHRRATESFQTNRCPSPRNSGRLASTHVVNVPRCDQSKGLPSAAEYGPFVEERVDASHPNCPADDDDISLPLVLTVSGEMAPVFAPQLPLGAVSPSASFRKLTPTTSQSILKKQGGSTARLRRGDVSENSMSATSETSVCSSSSKRVRFDEVKQEVVVATPPADNSEYSEESSSDDATILKRVAALNGSPLTNPGDLLFSPRVENSPAK